VDPTGESSTTQSPSSTSDDGTTDTGELPPFDPMCDEESTSSEGTSGSTDESGTDTGNPGGGPDGSPCSSDDECASDRCYLVPLLGGICGECVVDGDCEGGGCSPPNPLTSAPSVCNQGEQGGGCQSDAACCGIGICNPLIVAPGIITVSTCGQCDSPDDCPGGAPCQPSYDFANFSGLWECVPADSLPDGHGCTPDAAGDGACESGICAAVSLMGIITLGVCSECETDADCDDGQTCSEPGVDLVTGPFAGTCV
jgi:hypothetical protein